MVVEQNGGYSSDQGERGWPARPGVVLKDERSGQIQDMFFKGELK